LTSTNNNNNFFRELANSSSLDEENFLRLITGHVAVGANRHGRSKSFSKFNQNPNANLLFSPEKTQHLSATASCIQEYKDTMKLLEKEKSLLEDEVKLLQKDLHEAQNQLKEEERKYLNDMDYLKEQIIQNRDEKETHLKQLQETKEKLRIETVYKNEGLKQI